MSTKVADCESGSHNGREVLIFVPEDPKDDVIIAASDGGISLDPKILRRKIQQVISMFDSLKQKTGV